MRCIVDGSVLQIFFDQLARIAPDRLRHKLCHSSDGTHLNILAALLRQRCRALGSMRRLRGPGSLLKDVIPRSVQVVMNSSRRSSLHTVSRRRNVWYTSWSSMGKSRHSTFPQFPFRLFSSNGVQKCGRSLGEWCSDCHLGSCSSSAPGYAVCSYLVIGVFPTTLWVHVFTEFAFVDALKFEKAPSSHRGAEGRWRCWRLIVAFSGGLQQTLSLGPCAATVQRMSSRPQPLGSVGDDTPCEDTREDVGLSV